MARKRLLVLLKPLDWSSCHEREIAAVSCVNSSKVSQAFKFLRDRMLVHKNAIDKCLGVLKKKAVNSVVLCRNDLSRPVRDVDLVITIGGDGTLLHAGHFVDDSVPILGVNSDPTIPEEVEHNKDLDASRSTGYLCATTAENFEKTLDDVLKDRSQPSELARIAVSINSKIVPTPALNDVLVLHPCPAAVSRFSFRVTANGKALSSLIHSRSSGLRVSTATGSTAATLSAGGFSMPILLKDLQYMVREPILLNQTSHLMHGFVKPDESLDIAWACEEGVLYIDGHNVVHPFHHGDNVSISAAAPMLKLFLPPHLL